MHMELERVLPNEIEKRSMEIITSELPHPHRREGGRRGPAASSTPPPTSTTPTTCISPQTSVRKTVDLLKQGGVTIVTDTNMAFSGVNKAACKTAGRGGPLLYGRRGCGRRRQGANGTTRATASMDKAAALDGPVIFAIGNAPTALVRICELMDEGQAEPGPDHRRPCGLCQRGAEQGVGH